MFVPSYVPNNGVSFPHDPATLPQITTVEYLLKIFPSPSNALLGHYPHSTPMAYEPSKEATGNLSALGEQSSASGGALGERFSDSLCSSGGSRKGWNIDARTNDCRNL
jgi:hypothetical protein